MRNIFAYDGALTQALEKIVDCLFLSLVWFVVSVPIITIGASTTALYYTVVKCIRHGRSRVWREFWQSFRSNFKQATCIWLIALVLWVVMAASCYSAYLLFLVGQVPRIMLILIFVISCILLTWTNYLFSYLARFEDETIQILKNCGWIAFLNFFWSILLFLLFITSLICIVFAPPGVLIVPAIYMLGKSYILEHVFRKYMSEKDMELEDERNYPTGK